VRATGFAEPQKSAAPEAVRTTRASGFGETSIAIAPPRTAASSLPKTTAVEIVSKPRPLYTQEARRLRIEGEVLLEVLFTASGTARVERVLRGLGHGLDESAAASVADIQFRPAQRAGQPVDQTATVHITFQLAY
jgi:TonB family protein